MTPRPIAYHIDLLLDSSIIKLDIRKLIPIRKVGR